MPSPNSPPHFWKSAGPTHPFGPAGAVIIWLLWAYYTALTSLFSAEILQALARHRGWAWWQPVTASARRAPLADAPLSSLAPEHGTRDVAPH